ncbi:Hypothetical predicted protein [Mytilus galloprovincialis]|uniref:Peptidase A2 domain-containing protein n=1 Tax=Mytilus galloprovincialis TaxID=29158 RepID=A0A8B6GCT5_MYTGA|nr:Hypothetical predicted protein [Mytilus galloprovincialis]
MNTEAKMYQQRQSSGDTEGLLGSPNEVTVVINGLQASALLDTGSTVSTVSQSFHRQYLADSPIQTLNQILNIECADGQNMPYLGYISADLQLPEEMQERLRKAYDTATRNIFAAQKRQKTHYDQKVKGAVLKPGDRVLVKTLAFNGKHKLADRWEDDPYCIISQPNCGIPVYVDTQDNTNSDVPVVDLQEEGTLGFTGDGHDGAESSDQQGTGLGGDALPVDINTAAEPNPEEADEPTIAPEQQQRRRRILPTPPRDPPVATRPQRERKPPKYLEDYVVSKQATTIQQPDWLMRIHWLESEARKGRFKGLEIELSRTILDIMRTAGIGIAFPILLPIQIAAVVCGSLGGLVKLIRRKLTTKSKKHYEIKTMAECKLNSIKDLISKSLTDGQISADEFKLILDELEKFNEMKLNKKESL